MLDLHTFRPKDVGELVSTYLAECRARLNGGEDRRHEVRRSCGGLFERAHRVAPGRIVAVPADRPDSGGLSRWLLSGMGSGCSCGDERICSASLRTVVF